MSDAPTLKQQHLIDMAKMVNLTLLLLMEGTDMQILVNYIYCYDVVYSTATVAQQNPIVPREGERVSIDGWTYTVESITHKFDVAVGVQVIDVEIGGKRK
ncbi:hypothetical protein NFU35_003928 [Escherichia coli]|nr:hypothetical protein [Escherichia coli]